MDQLQAAVRIGGPVGVEELLGAPSPAMRGSIKSRPRDFEVREIAADGAVVDLSERRSRVPTQEERRAALQETIASAKAASAKPERLTFAEPEGGWTTALDELVGSGNAAQIEKVARSETNEHDVAAPGEFRDRVYLQVCIQSCFPGLDCTLVKTEDSDSGSRVLVALDPVYRKLLGGGMSVGNCDKVLQFLRLGASDPAASKGLELDHDDSKEARTAVHRLISKCTSCFKTATETRGGVQRVVVYFSPKSSKKRKRSEPEPCLRFVLRKTNIEHFACVEKLSRLLRCPQSALAFAGTKDKTAVTYQHMTVRGVDSEQLLALNRAELSSEADASLDGPSFEVGDLTYVSKPMSLGEANGNRFTIVIRDLASDDAAADLQSTLTANFQHIQRLGFINYFGFQRVGQPSSAVRPHHIGEKMVAGNWRDALRLLLAVDERESPEVKLAKQLYLDQGDVDGALKRLPMSMGVERTLLQGLKRYGAEAFEQAVAAAPHSRRLLYLHAYQSYLFNRAASFRVRLGGQKVIEGDLVAAGATGDASAAAAGADSVRAVTLEEAETMNRTLANPLASVVLPLPGTSVLLPANAVGEMIRKMAAEDGTESALLRSGPLKGAYRRLTALPTDVQWTLDESEKAATASFSLPTGSFATMCLREVLKTDL